MASRRRWCVALVAVGAVSCMSCREAAAPSAAPTSRPPSQASAGSLGTTGATVSPETTGVPGLDDADPFCAAWAAYVGTVQALGVAASFGALSTADFANVEVRAAPRLVEVAGEIEAAWPAELDAEHDAVVENRVGPYARRAQHAVDALAAAGASTADLETLQMTWQSALATRDPASTVIGLPEIDPSLNARVGAAAQVFNGALTPFAQDPSLAVDSVSAPLTDAYLATHCPDLAASGVGDAL